jgi:glycine cleavage system H protein
MTDYLEFTIDKFTFRIAPDRFYNDEGVWVKVEDHHVRIGISDYLQKRSGDMVFVEIKPIGTEVRLDDEIAVIETIKVNISLPSPITGKVVEINPEMESSPEVINQDPYENGWLMEMETFDWKADVKLLLDAQTYFAKIKGEAEQEVNS